MFIAVKMFILVGEGKDNERQLLRWLFSLADKDCRLSPDIAWRYWEAKWGEYRRQHQCQVCEQSTSKALPFVMLAKTVMSGDTEYRAMYLCLWHTQGLGRSYWPWHWHCKCQRSVQISAAEDVILTMSSGISTYRLPSVQRRDHSWTDQQCFRVWHEK